MHRIDPSKLISAAAIAVVALLGLQHRCLAARPIAVLSAPGMPYFMANSDFKPRDAVDALTASGIDAELVSAADLASPGGLDVQHYAALLTVYGNTFPLEIADAVEAFHEEGGALLNFGVPFCHPCVPAGPVGWMLYRPPYAARETSIYRSPPYSLKIVGQPGDTTWSGAAAGRGPAKEGDQFRVSAAIRSDGEVNDADHLFVRFFDESGGFISQAGPTLPADASNWTMVTGEVTAPPKTALRDFCIAVFSQGTVWMDDASLTRVNTDENLLPDPTLDGTLAGGCYDDLGHADNWFGHDSIGTGGFRVVEGVTSVGTGDTGDRDLLGLGPIRVSEGPAGRALCVIDPESFPPEDEVVGLFAAKQEDRTLGHVAAFIRHRCDRFDGAVDAWLGAVVYDRPLADRITAAAAGRVLYELGEIDQSSLQGIQTAASRLEVPPVEPVTLPPQQAAHPNMFPKPRQPADSLLSIKTATLTPEDLLTITALQGLANRPTPRVYIADEWQPEIEETGRSFKALEDPWKLVDMFRAKITGVTVYDPDLPATANVALTLCGLFGWLPVAPQQLDREPLSALPVRFDLRGKFDTEADAYRWALENLRPDCTDRVLCHEKQAEPLRPWAAATAATIADYVVQQRVFSWHMNRAQSRADIDVARDILATYPLNTPVIGHFGPEPNGAPNLANEWDIVRLCSEYGKLYVFLVSHNASVHAGFPTPELHQHHPQAPKPPGDFIYVAPYLSDGDSPTTFYHGRERWRDPARGKVPIAWSLGPTTLELYPLAARWFYDQATPMDTFVCACSGAGYCYPRVYGEHIAAGHQAALDAFLALTDTQMRRADLDICHVHHHAGLTKAELDRYAEKVGCLRGILADYSRVVADYDAANTLAAGRVPVFHAATSFKPPEGRPLPEIWPREISQFVPADRRPAFVHFFGVLWFAGPLDIAATAEALDADTYRFVRPDTLSDLYRMHAGGEQ